MIILWCVLDIILYIYMVNIGFMDVYEIFYFLIPAIPIYFYSKRMEHYSLLSLVILGSFIVRLIAGKYCLGLYEQNGVTGDACDAFITHMSGICVMAFFTAQSMIISYQSCLTVRDKLAECKNVDELEKNKKYVRRMYSLRFETAFLSIVGILFCLFDFQEQFYISNVIVFIIVIVVMEVLTEHFSKIYVLTRLNDLGVAKNGTER